jgi:cobalamin synthase
MQNTHCGKQEITIHDQLMNFSFLAAMVDNTFLCSLTHVQWCVIVEGCIVLVVCKNLKRRMLSYQKRKRKKKDRRVWWSVTGTVVRLLV